MNTLGAQSRAGKTYYFFGRVRHNGRIAQLDGLSERVRGSTTPEDPAIPDRAELQRSARCEFMLRFD